MSTSGPPIVATWMLEHFTFGYRNEALAGDLLEEIRCGRTAGWYWRQVFAAMAVAFSRSVRSNRVAIVFAALWSVFAPAWLLIISQFEEHAHLNRQFYRMDWPWSSICDMGLLFFANLVFICAGIVLYLLPGVIESGGRRFWAIGRGILASVPILMVLWAALIVAPKYFMAVQTNYQLSLGPVHTTYIVSDLISMKVIRTDPNDQWDVAYGDEIATRDINPFSAITDVRGSSILYACHFFSLSFARFGACVYLTQTSEPRFPRRALDGSR